MQRLLNIAAISDFHIFKILLNEKQHNSANISSTIMGSYFYDLKMSGVGTLRTRPA